MKKEYLKLDKIEGPLIILSDVEDVSYGEILDIDAGGKKRKGKVIRVEGDKVVAQVFEGTAGMSTQNSSVRFTGKPFEIPLSKEILGRTFNGIGQPIDKGGKVYSEKKYNVNGRPINPVARKYPRNYIQTGISSIDILSTLIRGQKLPIFSGSGMSHNELAAQIVKQAKISSDSNEEFGIVFAAIGVKHDDANYFKRSFEESGAIQRVAMYLNLADDPIVERTIAPRCALTAAEYLAFEEGMHILVIMTDITSYCEALREISSAREEVPSRKGYPGYLYSDLATLYERAGMMKDSKGSITLLPILTMPNDDITHPVPDLTGYITEGQIVLGRELYQNNIYPPVNILPSLSRLMKDGIGEGFTREDHPEISNQLFASYSRVQEVRALSQIIGEDDLSKVDRKYMEFGRKFEGQFITQGFDENRDVEESLNLAWNILGILPEEELDRLSPEMIEKYYKK
ncbi:V-type ATP synthase subunit B [Maledivibacter halophilus]|uniref:V-type ATP synthase beta chain n=1 Tax=Maledivibacter halophilus TaxID=36842 RepID=A0A1T5JZM4_9FIRM|nr:V-type ATP synthase subunit B [Maledivibacter halophilus]SKC56698.1 V/A-type H+-transporting ATPase subunit B [Maledivibacter halophilus]